MDCIRVFEKDSPERDRLEIAARMMSLDGNAYKVEEAYFDYGQDWKWTTILRFNGPWGWVQVLCPRQQEMIVNARTPEEILEGIRWEYDK